MAMREHGWLACSPDGVGIIDITKLKFNQPTALENRIDECCELFSCLEIKNSLAESSIDKSIGRASVDVMTCIVGDTDFREYIPQEHIGQLLQQILVLGVLCKGSGSWNHVHRSCLLSASNPFYLQQCAESAFPIRSIMGT